MTEESYSSAALSKDQDTSNEQKYRSPPELLWHRHSQTHSSFQDNQEDQQWNPGSLIECSKPDNAYKCNEAHTSKYDVLPSFRIIKHIELPAKYKASYSEKTYASNAAESGEYVSRYTE